MYLGEDNFRQQPLWEAISEIYVEFRRICDKHGFRHYVAYGTALGAVRHKGFIPWDDDFDVMMPRCDYEKLKEHAASDFPKCLRFIDWQNAKDYAPATYGKIQNCDRKIIAEVESKIGRELPHGIYIDVFPLDGVPTAWVQRVVKRFQGFLLSAIASSFLGVFRRRRFKTCCWRLIGFLVRKTVWRISSLDNVAACRDAIAKQSDFAPGNMCGCIFSPYGAFRDVCSYEVYGTGHEIPFGEMSVIVPSDYDSYLRVLYGDYMQMPPEGRRVPRHVSLASAPWKYGPTR